MDETKQLVSYVHALTYRDIPVEVVKTAKLCLLDNVGVALYGSKMPWTKAVAGIVKESDSKRESSVWGEGSFDTVAPAAALVNGTAAHGVEMDDRQSHLNVHTGAMVIPAAFAAAERVGAGGEDLLLAVISGYEVSYRIARAVPAQLPKGFHTPAHMGMWGAVAAASKAMDVNQEQMLSAFGIAGSFVSGTWEFSSDPTGNMIKRLHGGWAAQAGIVAALLAGRGITGPRTVLEGKYGYCRLFAGKINPQIEKLTEGLGGSFEILNREVKPYSAWGGSHFCIEALNTLTAEHSLEPDQVEQISVGGSQKLFEQHESREPHSIMAAQYSLPFVIALSFYGDLRDPGVWRDEVLHDERIKALIDRIDWHVDAEIEGIYTKTGGYGGAKVDVTLKNGMKFQKVINHPKGTVHNPMTEDELCKKFLLLAGYILPREGLDQAIDAINRVDRLGDIRQLGKIFQTG
jgi:2-methylcitrate dehydratase PrpD